MLHVMCDDMMLHVSVYVLQAAPSGERECLICWAIMFATLLLLLYHMLFIDGYY